jgi:hypothetical protein
MIQLVGSNQSVRKAYAVNFKRVSGLSAYSLHLQNTFILFKYHAIKTYGELTKFLHLCLHLVSVLDEIGNL